MPKSLVFLWDNFGPLHADRCEAVAQAMPSAQIIGLELYGSSDTYAWNSEEGKSFHKITLFTKGHPRGLSLVRALWRFRRKNGRAVWFLCHYDWQEIFLFALVLRLHGDRVYTMGCSKFDDIKRMPWREWLKTFFLLPYQGAIGSGLRSRDYFRFLGMRSDRVVGEYNTVSQDRIRQLAAAPPAPGGNLHAARHFTIVARLVPKKNLDMAIRAYAIYKASVADPRPLHICGNGPLETELRALTATLGLEDLVLFHGFLQTKAIAGLFGSTLALILPSIEEQFGNVVPEAQAMGLPVILSDNCGARDLLVRTGVNGFVIEPDNTEGLAFFMRLLTEDASMWRNMAIAATDKAALGDTSNFAKGVKLLWNS